MNNIIHWFLIRVQLTILAYLNIFNAIFKRWYECFFKNIPISLRPVFGITVVLKMFLTVGSLLTIVWYVLHLFLLNFAFLRTNITYIYNKPKKKMLIFFFKCYLGKLTSVFIVRSCYVCFWNILTCSRNEISKFKIYR